MCFDVNNIFKILAFCYLSLPLVLGVTTSSSAAEHSHPDSNSEIPWFYAEQGIMGTVVSVKLQHPDKKIAQKISQDIFALMWDINNEMSNFEPDSLLSKINQHAHKHPLKITDRLFGITNEHASIDLGGIAKGYAISQALKILQQNAIKNAYITAGGDSYALGSKNGRPWYIAIKNPRDGKNNIILPVSGVAISTSGDYERFFIEDNIRYHHIINPATGHSATKSVSVTVIGPSPEDTDALSTTLFVLGEKKGLELINTIDGYDAIYVYPDGKMSFSNGLKRE
ncbi:MAG: FAD:protein FMN transferase [Gammaproteobacteria bacterium]